MQLVPYQRPSTMAQAWFWLVPAVVLLGADRSVQSLLLGAGAGVAWQAVFRRDLVDRLTTVCIFVVVGAVLTVVTSLTLSNWTVDIDTDGLATYLACVVALVLTEQTLRLRDLRRHERASPRETVPARP